MARTVIGLYESRNEAQQALQDLQEAGFGQELVQLITSGGAQLSDMLVQTGIPQEDAALYAEGVQSGGAIVLAQALPDADAQQVADILDRYNVVDISRRGRISSQTTEMRSASNRTRFSNDYQGGETVIPIVEEEIRVGKREVESGGVRVDVDVEEVPVEEQVTLRDERVRVERRSVDQAADPSVFDQVGRTGSFEVRERDEQAVVDKQARVVEEVVINKDVEERTETIQDSVRRTDVDVEQIQGETRSTGSVVNESIIDRDTRTNR